MQTDYLVVGSGAVGMAFADTLLDESDAHITIVDRHARPGGHWNDAYSFVTLHQPSAYYGVNSTELGSGRIDTHGPNAGLYEMASGAELNAYYDKLMQQKMLPSGRVTYYPMSDYRGDGRIVSLLSGAETRITVRKKTVDATWFSPPVPSTHTPKFTRADGVRMVPPNALPQLWQARAEANSAQQFCVLGAGKTAMDAVVWLLRHGANAEAIQWVVPRDSWIVNRAVTQPGMEFFFDSIGAEASRLEAIASSTSVDEVFAKFEEHGAMLRIDQSRTPTMFHYATISTGEVELLRQVTRVHRLGRVQALEAEAMVLEQGRVAMDPDVLYVDCTASGLSTLPNEPVFQPGRIVIQLVRAPLVTLSAGVTAYLEVHGADDTEKNSLAVPVHFPQDPAGFLRSLLGNAQNQIAWSQHKGLRQWVRNSRLDAFGKLVAAVDPADAEKMALLERIRASSKGAMTNMMKLLA